MVKFGWPFWAAVPAAGLICFVAGFLFGFPALRLGGLYLALATFALAVATPQLLSYNGIEALTGGPQGLQLGKLQPPVGRARERGSMDVSYALLVAARMLLGRRQSGQRADRTRAHRNPRPSDRRRGDGRRRRAIQDHRFGLGAFYAGVAGGLGALAVGFVSPESFGLSLSLAFLVGVVIGGLASISGAIFGALFIEFVPNIADQLSVHFGESAKALPGAIYGVLLILRDGGRADGDRGHSCARSVATRLRTTAPTKTLRTPSAKAMPRRKPMTTRRTFLQSGAAAAAVLTSGARGARADTPGITDTEIKIGQTMPYSGPASAYGVIGRPKPPISR